MKIIVIGATGTIGQAVVKELSLRHEVISVSNQRSDVRVDITEVQSIESMYKTLGKIDAVVVCTGKVHFGELSEMQQAQYEIGLKNKLMGQVNLVLIGMKYLNDHGSFTLTSGILNHDPIRLGSSASMVNGALDGFVKGAAIELPRNLRINAVSPIVVLESMGKYGPYFQGFLPVPVEQVALAYSKSVEGAQTGQIYRVGY
jgi:NAD(P)-dependent dehydrogenase (short-subunit alcohol dehydrogenase family)